MSTGGGLVTRPGPINNRPQVNNLPHNAGVTLVEMLVVVAIIAIMVGISFPALSSGRRFVALESGLQRVATSSARAKSLHRRQMVMEVAISKAENTLDHAVERARV